jgi:FMN phosphatase YigB (HAD superfamily)
MLEAHLGLSPEEILYVGDHLYSDVHVTKDLLRWRTVLVVRDIEREIQEVEAFRPKQAELSRLMAEKERVEHTHSTLRLALEHGGRRGVSADPESIREGLQQTKAHLAGLDAHIAPLAEEAGTLFNERWGLLMRAGLDKSYLARQLERYADAYTSRVSNFLAYTPYVYLRAPRVSLPHDVET